MKYKKIIETGITIPIPETYKDSLYLIKSDYFRYKGKTTNLLGLIFYALMTSHFGFSFWFRLASVKGILTPLCLFMHKMYYLRYGLQIVPGTKVGLVLYLSHGFGIIVNPDAVIGNNCNLSQFSTIGANGRNPAAVIGDNVYIGPSVCIVNRVIIGSNSTIGAGAVVTKDIPSGATVAGVPAKIISYKLQGAFVNHRWPLSF